MASKKRKLPDWMEVCENKDSDHDSVSSLGLDKQVSSKKGNSYKTKEEKNWDSSKSARRAEASAEFDKLLLQSLPDLKYSGNLTYCSQKNDCSHLCELIEFSYSDSIDEENFDSAHSAITPVEKEKFMGFDMEWPVSYQVGKQDKTALIQLCTGSDCCYLFHVSTMGCLPAQFQALLKNHSIKKVGIAIESDLWKLEKDFGIQVLPIIKNGIVDLSKYANKVLNTSENWSLEGLTRRLFKAKISKAPSVRKSDWSWYPLSETQKQYAATDAYVSYKIYEKLKAMDT